MKEKVIYTAIVGSYDTILQPKAINEDYDYILFSNDIHEDNIGVWKIKKIPYSNDDKTRIARYVKTHPEKLLEGYKHSVWMDANVQIISDVFYERISEHISANTLVSSMWHNERNCIYEEAAVVAFYELESEITIVNWLQFLLKEKYPQKNGLFETNVVYRCQNSPLIAEMDSLWWSCIDQYSRRDQLSFNYVLWKLHITCPYFLSDTENARNSDSLKYYFHENSKTRTIYLNNKHAFIPFYKSIHPQLEVSILKNKYIAIAKSWVPKLSLLMLGQYYRLMYHLK